MMLHGPITITLHVYFYTFCLHYIFFRKPHTHTQTYLPNYPPTHIIELPKIIKFEINNKSAGGEVKDICVGSEARLNKIKCSDNEKVYKGFYVSLSIGQFCY